MSEVKDIAIIIPLYKSAFFEEALSSVLEQTDRNFHVYICNDASKDASIEPIIESFGRIPNLTYHRFEENLGQSSLAAHWNRCIEMVGNERWIWLFSDDDVMDPDCIENFRKCQAENPRCRLFRFDSIKFRGDYMLKENKFPKKVSAMEFMRLKFNYLCESYAVEYIFDRSMAKQKGMFPEFPLAWCSDDLFWIRASSESDIITVPGSTVYWRSSGENISGKINSPNAAAQKMEACILFIESVKSMDIYRRNDMIEQWLFNWVIHQYKYLGLSPAKSHYLHSGFFDKICSLLPKAAERHKTEI